MQRKLTYSFIFFLFLVTSMIGQLSSESNYGRIQIENGLFNNIAKKNKSQSDFRPDFENNNQLKNITGQYIIRYTTINKRIPSGNEILQEYDVISKIIEKVTSLRIKKYKEVNSFLVSKMVRENITEAEVVARVKNNSSKSKNFRVNGNIDKAKEYNSAQIMMISFDDYEYSEDIIEQVKNSYNEFLAKGIEIIEIEPNYILSTNYYPNDTYFDRQWGHTLINSVAAWDIERGSSDIVIGVIDTGIDTDHEDLKGNINKTFEYDFVDIDTSAYIAQNYSLLPGEDYKERDSIAKDYNGHGTHCAGIIGAKGNNSLGVCGVGHNLSLVSLRAGFSILNQSGEELGVLETDDIIAAIDYAALTGIDVINMSFGGSGYSSITQASCKNAVEKGVVLIAAAGNSSSSSKNYPAAYDGVISVSAVDINDNPASFSSFGYWVDVAAPGVSIYSTVPRSGGVLHNSTGYSYLSGTSMAAPFVSGLAGLILSKNPGASPETVENIIKNSLDEITGKAFYYGLGRINVFKALQLNADEVPHMEVNITSPGFDELIKNNVSVIGTATGENFTLSIGLGVYPATWTVINTGATTINGNLGTINTSTIPSGGYSVKLTTKTGDFQIETRTYIRITNDQDIKLGFPINISVNTAIDKYLLIDDLDFDGKKEILIYSRMGYLDIYNYDGSVYKNGPIKLPEDGWIISKPAVFDFDNDGKKEIVVLCKGGLGSSKFLSVFLCVFDLDGKILEGWPIYYNDGGYIEFVGTVMVDDINNDGKFEIIAMHGDNKKCTMRILDINGNVFPGWPYIFDEGYTGRSNPVIGDIDGDGKKEIVVTKFYSKSPNSMPHYIIALDTEGNLKTNYNYKLNGWGWVTAGADVDKDNITEIMTQDGLIGEYGSKLPWSLSKTYVYSKVAFADVTNNYKPEIFYGERNQGAYLTDYLGTPLQGWPVFKEKYSADGDHIIGDIDNDGNKEIIINFQPNTFDSRDQKPGLNIFDVSGKMLAGFPKFEGIYYFNDYVIDDIDNNGLTDIICMDVNEGIILAMEPGGNYNSKNQEWPTYLHDNRNTNNYNSTYLQPNLFNIKNIEIDEDNYTSVRFSMENLDWENYDLTMKADTSAIELIANRGTLSVIPKPDWNGASVISIFLKKENIVDSCKFDLTVKPIDDIPSDFSLISPTDSTLIEISADTYKDSLCFKWEKLYEKDNDPITFNVSFDSPFNFLNTDVKEKDSLIIPFERFYNYMKTNGKWDYRIGWTVTCTDGKSKINAKQINILIVKRINSEPEVFNLLSPADSSLISVIAENLEDSICFKWNETSDVDGDTLQYTIVFEEPFDSLNFDMQLYDSLKVPIKVFYDYMLNKDLLSTSVIWKVNCFDGTLTVESSSSYMLFIKRDDETGVENTDNRIPKEYYISQNYPNPFNPSTIIDYAIPKPSFVSIKIYDILGSEVANIVNENKDVGNYKALFNCGGLSSGIYFYQIRAGNFSAIKKLILIK